MGEVGCLKDGHFQNLQVEGKITASSVSRDFRGDDIAVSETTYGVGVVGVLSGSRVPELRRWTENGIIITQLKVDITGLSAKGTAADVIGLATGGVAFIYKNVVSDNGIIFKITVACIELPGEETATITTDIDFAFNANGALAYDEGAGTSTLLDMGTSVAGTTKEFVNVPITTNHYMYITEGAGGSASTGLYSAGQYIITFYGATLFT